MGAETVVDKVRAIAERVAGGYGLEIFDVQYRREAPGMVLRVRIDRPGPASTEEDSVSVHDCANVSRDLSAIFDVEEIVPTAYTLEVSSPGLDRLLRKEQDFVRFAGHKARIKLRVPVEGQRNFVGVLRQMRAGKVELDVNGRIVSVDLANLDKARLVPAI